MTDCKILSPDSLKDNFVWAISGPPTSNGRFPPFDWSLWPNVTHRGMPLKYNFSWQKIPLDIRKEKLKEGNLDFETGEKETKE